MRPNRAATSGYWKATGTDKPILSSTGDQKVGVKKALVFYGGKPPKGIKTNWIMHEYRLVENASFKLPVVGLSNKKSSLRVLYILFIYNTLQDLLSYNFISVCVCVCICSSMNGFYVVFIRKTTRVDRQTETLTTITWKT